MPRRILDLEVAQLLVTGTGVAIRCRPLPDFPLEEIPPGLSALGLGVLSAEPAPNPGRPDSLDLLLRLDPNALACVRCLARVPASGFPLCWNCRSHAPRLRAEIGLADTPPASGIHPTASSAWPNRPGTGEDWL